MLKKSNNRGFVLAVSAPSGTGKTSLCDRLAQEVPGVVRSVSVTTRPLREGEIAQRDYEFVTPEEFQKRQEAGYFLETAQVFKNWYGTPKKPVEKAIQDGQVIVMDIDTVGAFKVREALGRDAVLLFVLPPSLEELEARLRARGKNSPEDLQHRLQTAAHEIQEAPRYDYVLENCDFNRALSCLKAVVEAERLRAYRHFGLE